MQGTSGDGVSIFEGVPYAAPPVGSLRWREPQPVAAWVGVRQADHFGDRPMQPSVYNDMRFRSAKMSEDCLYLNVWTPAGAAPGSKLPVLLYFYGGGYMAGDASEYRYDGASLARRGIVVVTCNYRLNVFGFFAHPQLTAESPHHASGNYGLLDQSAALHWVHDNIAAFGGNAGKITIGGQSAGSFSVCAQMGSPLSRDLIAGAIGQSGGMSRAAGAASLAQAEVAGERFAAGVGASSLADLRALPADVLLQAVRQKKKVGIGPTLIVDGYFLPKPLETIYAAGEQAHVPLLAGWTNTEFGYRPLIKHGPPTTENYAAAVHRAFGPLTDDLLRLYPPDGDDARDAAGELAGDVLISYGTWKWTELARQTGGQPVYRYLYEHPRPPLRPEHVLEAITPWPDAPPADELEDARSPTRGGRHANDIEYALGTLASDHWFAWTADDQRVSEVMEGYFANFIKTGDPNGPALPTWPAATASAPVMVMHLNTDPHVAPETTRARDEFIDGLPAGRLSLKPTSAPSTAGSR